MNGTTAGVLKVTALQICVPTLDPITLIIQDTAPGVGSLIVQCYDTAWCAWWGGMGEGKSVAMFLGGVDAYYLAGCLIRSAHLKQNKTSTNYLVRVATAVI